MAGVTEQGESHRSESSTSGTTIASSSRGGGMGNATGRRGLRERRQPISLVEDCGVYDSTCGYCKASRKTARSQGLWAHALAVQDYQDLLDRGWRRSGMFLYKPCMKETCCPPYTIRLEVDAFVPSKEQARVLKRMQRYINGTYNRPQTVGELHEDKDDSSERDPGMLVDSILASCSDERSEIERTDVEAQDLALADVEMSNGIEGEELIENLKLNIKASVREWVEKGLLPQPLELPEVLVKRIPRNVKGKLKEGVESEANYTSNIAFTLAATINRRRKTEIKETDTPKGKQESTPDVRPQEIAERVAIILSELTIPGVRFVRACAGHLNFVVSDANVIKPICMAQERQITIGTGDTTCERRLSESLKTLPPGGARKLQMRMSRSSFDAEEYDLYKKYQIRVHNDRPDEMRESSYRDFLVKSPLSFVSPARDGSTPSCGFGSFHQQYRIDGKLIAVGVVDILPHCLSSKYLFWDPDYAFLSLGKYSALQEIMWVQKEKKLCPSLKYYYLGFYIHSCPKMRYKAAYYPSELLCPERYRWVPYELARPLLDKQAYACLSDIQTGRPEISRVPGKGGGLQDAVGDSRDESNETTANAEQTCGTSAEHHVDREMVKRAAREDATLVANDISGLVGDIKLYLRGDQPFSLPFKQLGASGALPRHQLDGIASNLHKFLQDVGPSLATRMAYALP